MPRSRGLRFVYTHPESSHVRAEEEIPLYVSADGLLACHCMVEDFNEHVFIGPSARGACFADLVAEISKATRTTTPLQLIRTDEVLDFPFPDNPRRLVYCP